MPGIIPFNVYDPKFIDVYIPETKVIIEQKSRGIALDKKIPQSGGIELTPYEWFQLMQVRTF